jgi:hypothetical protein
MGMTESIDLEVARVVDRDMLLEALREQGIEAEPIEEEGRLGFRIPCADGESDGACDDMLARTEQLIADGGLPLVPHRGDGFVFLRPPGD